VAGAVSTVLVSVWLGRANRLAVWAACHIVMAAGVLLPAVWRSLASVTVAALLVGGTFMVITMVAMQEARVRAGSRAGAGATEVLGRMTAGFALGQLVGPLVNTGIGRLAATPDAALRIALALSAAGLAASAVWLWTMYRNDIDKENV
jgi:hypothetical protein